MTQTTRMPGIPLLPVLILAMTACSGGEQPAAEEEEAAVPEGPALFFEESCCPNDLECQDGDWCTGIETCDCWGECGPGEPPCLHDPDPTDPCIEYGDCIVDRYDPPGEGYGQGHCEIINTCTTCVVDADCAPAPDACTDYLCNASGICEYFPLDCDDGDLCTNDSCNPATGCLNTPIVCSDPDPCLDGSCDPATGTCVFVDICCYADSDCPDDGNVCTDEHCNLGTGMCYTVNNNDPCADDGNPCTEDVCSLGACTHPAWADPSAHACAADGNPCTEDVCQADGTCGHPPWPDPWNHACAADGNVCTEDVCQADGTCGHVAWPDPSAHACAGDGNACTQDICQADGTCGHLPWPDGSLPLGCCNDDSDCDDGNPCSIDVCLADWTCSWSNAPDGTPCTPTSSDPCVDGGECTGGVCLPTYIDPPNDQCPGSEDLGNPGTWGGVAGAGYGFTIGNSSHGDTTCAEDDYNAFDASSSYELFWGCNGDGAPELVYDFSYTVGSDYQMYQYIIDHYRSGADPHSDEFLYSRASCNNVTTQISCNDDCNYPTWGPLSGYCGAQLPSWLSSSVQIAPQPVGSVNQVNLFTDGYGNNTGEFDVRVRRRPHDNNGCTNWSNYLTQPHITGESVWRGNTSGYTNYHIVCADMSCSTWAWDGPPCVTPYNWSCSWSAWWGRYICTANDPMEAGWVARFPTAGNWHVYVDERANTGSFNTAIALWGPNEGSEDCGFGTYYGCDFGSGAEPASMRVDIGAAEVGDIYMVEISNVDSMARGNYELNVVYENPAYRGLHEEFGSQPDLQGYRIDFTPNETTGSGYSYTVTWAGGWPISPWSAGSGSLYLGDEWTATGWLPFYMLVGDNFYRGMRIDANGRVMLGNGIPGWGADYSPNVSQHYTTYEPQFAVYWTDLYNVTLRYGSGLFEGQSVFWLAWVPSSAYYSTSWRRAYFQVIFHIDGKVTYYYNRLDTKSGWSPIVGISGTANAVGTSVNYR